ncbi:MAG TPA: polyprenyl synthetase family protein [Dissulfurispiraceae bacterium]|nr:polyprenyl synthetase family protein [Dissulfurispiraceae bacterium]
MNVQDVFQAHASELRQVEVELAGIFANDVQLIPLVGRHILGGGGKRMRPLFLLLSANLCGYAGEKRAILGAVIEAIHTASLLHDDVIDGAETRRGKTASHVLWGNHMVVLIGDYLYSNALRIAVGQNSQKVMDVLSEATTRMSEAEILQLSKTGDPAITEQEYFQIISGKTGILISAACRIGAVLAEMPEEKETALRDFGLKAGIAFQLADDVLDYVAQPATLGKKLGKDLEEGKITMPLIHLLKDASAAERDEVVAIIKETSSKKPDESGNGHHMTRIIDLYAGYDSIDKALKTAQGLVESARKALSVFPDSAHKDALLALAEYSMQRKS